jgi:2-polyprenyl-3-methyl-5-hydroxy-6-metoxy-1,4-benzoquinol methylase
MSRWLEETGGTRGESYDQQFRELAASGLDVHGEAAFVDALLPAGSAVLDAGCGTGRVAIELARRGHVVTGVDSDASMLDVARRSPEVTWGLQDLALLDLEQRFDLVVAAGNVVVFLTPGTEAEVVRRLTHHLVPGGLLISGWRTDRLSAAQYSVWTRQAGLERVVRHASWGAEPGGEDAEWCVAVDRLPPAVS